MTHNVLHSPEERTSDLLRGGSPKSRSEAICLCFIEKTDTTSMKHAVADNIRLYSPGTGSRAHSLVSPSARVAAAHMQSEEQNGQKHQTLATLLLRQTYRCTG
jgi:hypothetical protein